jgi:hypothetical protein
LSCANERELREKRKNDKRSIRSQAEAQREGDPPSWPSPLRPNEAIVKTFRVVSDLPEETICDPRFFRLSIRDNFDTDAPSGDKIAVGDVLEVFAPQTRRLRFTKRAAAVNVGAKTVTWEDN